jgi:hypothetical protein
MQRGEFHQNEKCPFTKSGPAKDERGVDLISDALPFGRFCFSGSR